MDTLMSDQLLAPELCKLLQVKLQDTTAELDAAKQAIASLQIEMSGLRKGQTSVPGNSDCACTSAKEVERLRACIDEIQRNGVGTAKEVTSGLQNRVRNLETQLYRSRQEVRTFRQALAEINKDSGLDCIGTLAGFPAIDIPEMDALLPCISKKCQDPQKSVAGQFKAFLSGRDVLFCGTRAIWFPDIKNHAVLLAPKAKYEAMAGGDTWTISESLSQYIGETREVFHRRNDRKIYYIGTYQCVKTGDFSFVDFRNLSIFAKQDLARATFVNPRAAYTAGEMKKILNMYVAGEAQTMYLALQCVGFNQPLYDALLAARPRQLVEEAEQSCAKRVRDEANTASGVKWTNKKPKTHHQAVVDPEVSETETNDGFCL